MRTLITKFGRSILIELVQPDKNTEEVVIFNFLTPEGGQVFVKSESTVKQSVLNRASPDFTLPQAAASPYFAGPFYR